MEMHVFCKRLHGNDEDNPPVPAHKHLNGGGWVSNDSVVDDSVYVGPDAEICGGSVVRGNVKIFDYAIVDGGKVFDNAAIFEEALVTGHVWGDAQIFGDALIEEDGYAGENARVFGHVNVWGGAKVLGEMSVCGDVNVGKGAVLLGKDVVSEGEIRHNVFVGCG